jgi:ubiquinone/menaquinone biosynthesis C-methylase UbiE
MCPMTPQPEDHPSGTEPACDALTKYAPRALDALHEFVARFLPLLSQGISLSSLSIVLDVGCGRHLWGRHLFRTMLEEAGPDLVADAHIEGIEYCPEIVKAARQGVRSGRVTQGDLLHLPVSYEGRFQVVQMRFLLLSLGPSDWPQALAELWHVCAPGGTVQSIWQWTLVAETKPQEHQELRTSAGEPTP